MFTEEPDEVKVCAVVRTDRIANVRWLGFRATDPKANNLPRPERERGQEHVRKAGSNRRRVCCCPATPERYG